MAKPKKKKDSKTNKNLGGRPLLFKTLADLQAAIDGYFDSCLDEVWLKRLKPEVANMPLKLRARHVPSDDDYEWVPDLDRNSQVRMVQIKPYTITALASHLGTTRETLLDYQEKDGFSDAIKKAKVKIHAYTEEQLFSPKIAAGVIFNLKNNYGYKDKIDVTTDDKPLPPGVVNNFSTLSDDELIKLAKAGQRGASS